MANNNLTAVVAETAYGELNHLIDLYQHTDDLSNCVPLMQPNKLVEIVDNCSINLTNLGIEMMEHIYKTYYPRLNDGLKIYLQPSPKLQSEFLETLLEGSYKLQLELEQYGNFFNASMHRLDAASSGARSLGSAAVGGAVGAMFGPIGAIIGGIAGGSLGGDKANEELKAVSQQLCIEFAKAVESTNKYLEGMANRMLEVVQKYKDIFETEVGTIS